jgi:hypothetical protein
VLTAEAAAWGATAATIMPMGKLFLSPPPKNILELKKKRLFALHCIVLMTKLQRPAGAMMEPSDA